MLWLPPSRRCQLRLARTGSGRGAVTAPSAFALLPGAPRCALCLPAPQLMATVIGGDISQLLVLAELMSGDEDSCALPGARSPLAAASSPRLLCGTRQPRPGFTEPSLTLQLPGELSEPWAAPHLP